MIKSEKKSALWSLMLVISILFASLASCSKGEIKEITPEDVVAAYENAGYEVWQSEEDDDSIEGERYTIRATHENGDYIFFHFFDSEENAEAYADTRWYNVLIWLFSVIYGEPSWLTTDTYGNIEIEYDDKTLYEPFKELIK